MVDHYGLTDIGRRRSLALVAAANEQGGRDNISVVLVHATSPKRLPGG
ncbi:MAG: hypothetical protein ACRELZ_06585 [Candidatus Rokuibacteriota bacterium]